jgi:hypothetical protein
MDNTFCRFSLPTKKSEAPYRNVSLKRVFHVCVNCADSLITCVRAWILSNTAASASELGLGKYTVKFWYIEMWVGGSGKRNKRKVGAGYETGTCFVAQDVSEKYQPQIHGPQGTFRADTVTVLWCMFCSHVLMQAEYSTSATRIP